MSLRRGLFFDEENDVCNLENSLMVSTLVALESKIDLSFLNFYRKLSCIISKNDIQISARSVS